MTVAAAGPTFRVQEIPFSYHGSWFDISPVIAEHTATPTTCIWSPTRPGMHPVLRLVPVTGAGRGTGRGVGHPGAAHLERTETVGSSWPTQAVDTVRLRGSGLGLRSWPRRPS